MIGVWIVILILILITLGLCLLPLLTDQNIKVETETCNNNLKIEDNNNLEIEGNNNLEVEVNNDLEVEDNNNLKIGVTGYVFCPIIKKKRNKIRYRRKHKPKFYK
jgi:hypothetical protein